MMTMNDVAENFIVVGFTIYGITFLLLLLGAVFLFFKDRSEFLVLFSNLFRRRTISFQMEFLILTFTVVVSCVCIVAFFYINYQ